LAGKVGLSWALSYRRQQHPQEPDAAEQFHAGSPAREQLPDSRPGRSASVSAPSPDQLEPNMFGSRRVPSPLETIRHGGHHEKRRIDGRLARRYRHFEAEFHTAEGD